ncbi:hypothetical protein [Campylobacter gracilis]
MGFIGGIPRASATMRTVANIKAGGLDRLFDIMQLSTFCYWRHWCLH